MIRVLGVSIENFRSWKGKHYVPLQKRGLVAVMGRNTDDPVFSPSNGCLAGDTMVDLPRNLTVFPKGIPISWLVGTTPWVYCWVDGKIAIRRASRIWKTKTAACVRVKLRGLPGVKGRYLAPLELTGTPEHPVLLSDGVTWRCLGELQPGDSLCSLYRRESGGWRSLLFWTGSGTMQMGASVGPRTVSEQQFVCAVNGPRPSPGHHAHHKNGDGWDHRVENLEWKEGRAHASEHTSQRNRTGEAGWQVSGKHPRGMAGKNHSPEARRRISETLSKLNHMTGKKHTPEALKRMSEAQKRWRAAKAAKVNHTVISVERVGAQDVYDMTVPGADNFVANGVVVHNSGKSGIVEALRWCLFGVTDTSADKVVNDQAQANTTVQVRLLDDDGRYVVVERYRARSKAKPSAGLKLSVNGVSDHWTSLDTSKTQETLEEILGMDIEVFQAAVLFHQATSSRTAFVDLGDAEAKAVLSRILPIGALDAAGELVSEEAKQRRLEEAQLSGQQQPLRNQVVALEHRIADASAKAATWATERDQRVAQLALELGAIETEGHDVRARLDALPPPFVPASFAAELRSTSMAFSKAQSAFQALQYQQTQLAEQLQRLAGGLSCPTCGQAVPDNGAQAHLAAELTKLQAQTPDVVGAFKAAQAASQTVAAKQTEAKAREMSASATEQTRLHLSSRRQQLLRQYDDTERRRSAEMSAGNPFHDLIKGDQNGLWVVQQKLQQNEAQLQEIAARLELLDWWVVGFGRSGLKSFVLDAYLEVMATETNRWVAIITGGRGWVRFETQRPTSSGKKLVEQFTVRCFVQRPDGSVIERNIRDSEWSGGERQRFALAVDFGLARLVAARAKRAWDLLVLDEVFRYIDSGGKQAFIDLLRQLAQEKSTVLVVDHDPTFTGYCDDTIVVEKRNGCSRVLENHDEDDSGDPECEDVESAATSALPKDAGAGRASLP